MTDTKKLIKGARAWTKQDARAAPHYLIRLARDLADALEAAEQRADALAAVVEKAAAIARGPWPYNRKGGEKHTADRVRRLGAALNATPAETLREHDARVWDEGFDRGFYSGQAMPEDSDASESPVCNPYQREEQDA